MEIVHRLENEALVVSLVGRLDAVNAPMWDKQMPTLLKTPARRVVFDLAQLEYISSAGLRSILAAAKAVKAAGAVLVLAGLQDMVKDVFRISGFERLVAIAPSLEAAMAPGAPAKPAGL